MKILRAWSMISMPQRLGWCAATPGIVCTAAITVSGCTLASAIAAHLDRGLSVDAAVWAAQEYTWQTLAAGFRPGMGQYIPDRFYQTRLRSGALDA
jgi:hypothetical protein